MNLVKTRNDRRRKDEYLFSTCRLRIRVLDLSLSLSLFLFVAEREVKEGKEKKEADNL